MIVWKIAIDEITQCQDNREAKNRTNCIQCQMTAIQRKSVLLKILDASIRAPLSCVGRITKTDAYAAPYQPTQSTHCC